MNQPSSNVVVVEDDSVTQQLISHVLERAGFQIQLYADGRGAFDYIAAGHRVDLLVTDIVMKEMGGVELIQKVRSELGLTVLPTILISGQVAEHQLVALMKLGPTAFLAKPFDLRSLQYLVEQMLAGQVPELDLDVPPPGLRKTAF